MKADPSKFGKYQILDELGRSRFATIDRAKDTTLGREVALKPLDPQRKRVSSFHS